MIIINNEELLRKPCEDAKENEIADIINQLDLELKNSAKLGRPGIGLAAPQIGIYKNVAIVRMGQEYNVNLVNSKIDSSYDEKLFRSEGCLSFPGKVEDTMRYQEIVVSNKSYPSNFIATGLFAVAIQHELDHLGGILLLDRAIKQKIKCSPNDPCLCSSNKKFKKCCGKNG